ncbi:hypothetical protein BGZ76_009842 [Entomortierella beljakovae]|nr:hypothetical protein BGZ76_009842 [Entomortierella beljakovae]
MTKKKHALHDTYSSSDDDEPRDRGVSQRDLQDEQDQFRDPMQRNRRKRTKEDAIYGSWGSEDDESPRPGSSRSSRSRRENMSFVASSSAKKQESSDGDMDDMDDMNDMDVDDEDEDEEDKDEDEDEDDDEDEDTLNAEREAAFKAMREKEKEEADAFEDRVGRFKVGKKPGIGLGLGSISSPQEPESNPASPASTNSVPSNNKAMAASLRAGLGLSGDAGSSSSNLSGSRTQRNKGTTQSSMSFFKNRAGFGDTGSSPGSPSSAAPGSPVPSPKPDTPLVAPVKVGHDYGAFSAKGSGFGLKMLEKMGWKKGYGLGAGGAGIVEPIQTKLRPVKMGIGFKGFKEKTDQTRAEEKRKGVSVSSDEDEEPTKSKAKGKAKKEEPKADGWKKTSNKGSRKGPKIEYKTAEEIQLEIESGDLPMAQVQQQKILDMTGKTVRELTSASQISSSMPFEHERFPELRHNLQLMADISTTDLEQLAREQKADHVRLKVLEAEGERMQKLVTQDELDLERLTKALSITDQCAQIAGDIQEATSNTYGAEAVEIKEEYIVEAFKEPFDLFSGLYFEEYKTYELDQVMVATIQDGFRKLLKDWDVLKNPTLGAKIFRHWPKLIRTSKVAYVNDRETGNFYGSKPAQQEEMTAYESLLNQYWLPKVRSAINNEWNPQDCDPVIDLLEAWESPLLPEFIRDNIVTQLVMPKLQREVEKWTPRDSLMLHTWIHPWLPALGQPILNQELFGSIRRKLARGLEAWNVLDPSGLYVLGPWHGVFDDIDMEVLLLKSVLPKLVEGLQMFEINPRDQKIEILDA